MYIGFSEKWKLNELKWNNNGGMCEKFENKKEMKELNGKFTINERNIVFRD